jgi:hypothetical protein
MAAPVGRIRWGRIVIGAVLLEVALVAAAVPLLSLVDNPFIVGAPGAPRDFTNFFVLVTVACFALGAFSGWWVARPIPSRFALHGALTGAAATAIYLTICSIPPNTAAAVVAAYGPFWFLLANGARISGAVLGAVYRGRTVGRGSVSVQ